MRRALVVGASGLVGRALVAQLLGDPNYREVHVLLRVSAAEPAPHPRLTTHRIDFRTLHANLDAVAMPAGDDLYCAVGTTLKAAGSKSYFRAVDFDVVIDTAMAARRAGASRLAIVSALGADPRSGLFYNKVKGEMEQTAARLGYASLVIARPSLLAGDRAATGQPVRRGERTALGLLTPIAWLLPAGVRPIDADRVARAMRLALLQGTPGLRVLESAELQRLGAR